MELGFAVFGLSGQSSADQRAFAERVRLPFPVLSDHTYAFADALRLPRFTAGSVTYLKRITFLVREGAIIRTFYPVHPPDAHAAGLVETLRMAAR